jgi:CBS domain-containing protein
MAQRNRAGASRGSGGGASRAGGQPPGRRGRAANGDAATGSRRAAAGPTSRGQVPGSRGGAPRTEGATPGERQTPRPGRGQRALASSDEAPETFDVNFPTSQREVGRRGKAGKAGTDMEQANAGRAGAQRASSSASGAGNQARSVSDVMTPAVEVATPSTELYYAARMMADRDVGAIPVVENTDTMRPVGIVTDRDIVVRGLAKRQDVNALNVGVVMSEHAVTVGPDATVDHAVRLMEEHQIRRIIVVDENSRTVGIVAQADVATKAPREETAELVESVSRPTRRERR